MRLRELDLPSVAQSYVDRRFGGDRPGGRPISRLAGMSPRLDEGYCRRVAAYYAGAPRTARDQRLDRGLDLLKWESLRQYQAIREAGIEVLPWLGGGQPYRSARQMRETVHRRRRLFVLLTDRAHGPAAPAGDAGSAGEHPLREPSGVRSLGVEFCFNDLFRAVHDLFGHVMLGHGFGPAGELLATFCHMHMYSEDVHPILLTEQVGQICWFFYGPHLENRDGRLPRRGDPGYVPPARRPYPEQKVFTYPASYLDEFKDMFRPRPEEPA